MPLYVASPSNLSQYAACPKKFEGQRSKRIKWKESPSKVRGIEVHAALEQAMKNGIGTVPAWPDGMNEAYTLTILQKLRGIAEAGATLHTEHEMAIDEGFKPSGWWDDGTMLRAKADLLLVVPGRSALIGDWKTGRMYADSDMQLRTEALLVHVLYAVPTINWSLFYVDQGQSKSGVVDFTQGLGQVKDILELMKSARTAVDNGGPFPAKKNKFCRWCDWYHTNNCMESGEW